MNTWMWDECTWNYLDILSIFGDVYTITDQNNRVMPNIWKYVKCKYICDVWDEMIYVVYSVICKQKR